MDNGIIRIILMHLTATVLDPHSLGEWEQKWEHKIIVALSSNDD